MEDISESKKSGHDELTFNTLPNQLTMARMAFVPLVTGMLMVREPFWDFMAAMMFCVASITDYFDGYLARTQKLVTLYGKLLDPLADKFLVVSALVMLQELGRVHPIVVILLICREMGITSLRALASAEGLIIDASQGGKWKTTAQMVAIPCLMLHQTWQGIPFVEIGNVLLYISLAMSLWSAKDYVIGFFKAVAEKRRMRAQSRKEKKAARIAARAARRNS